MSVPILIQAVPAAPDVDSGVGYVVSGTAREMRSRGWRVITVDGGDLSAGRRGRMYFHVPVGVAFRVARTLETLPPEAPCVVEAHAAHMGLVPLIKRIMPHRPFVSVFRSHGYWRLIAAVASADASRSAPSLPRTLRTELTTGNFERLGVRLSDAVVVQTHSEYIYTQTADGQPQQRVACIPSGVMLPSPEEAQRRRRLGAVTRLLWVGRSGLYKGTDTLREIARSLSARFDGSVILTIAGDAGCEALAGPAIDVLGQVSREEVARLMWESDAFLCTSRYEGFGLAALEAMGHGLPVISTVVGGLDGTLYDNVNGIVVREHRPEAFIAALRRYLDLSPQRREAMSAAAAEAARLHSWARHGEALDRFYRRLLLEQGSRFVSDVPRSERVASA